MTLGVAMKKTLWFLLPLSLLLWAGCSSSEPEEGDEVETELAAQEQTASNLPPELINGVLQSIPSPVETSVLIKESGSHYGKEYLNPADKADSYNSNYQRALNLGVYGADLGYTNIYSQSQDAILYMDAVKKMADGLNIGQFFDFETVRRLATNSENLDSLLLITTQNLQKINNHLQEKNQSKLSLLIITGGWVEGVDLLCKVVAVKPSDKLKERVGEQKIILGHLMTLYKNFASDAQMKDLVAELESLNKTYQEIEIIERIEGEPEMKIIDGVPTLVDNRKTIVYISEAQLKAISTQVAKVRALITQG